METWRGDAFVLHTSFVLRVFLVIPSEARNLLFPALATVTQ